MTRRIQNFAGRPPGFVYRESKQGIFRHYRKFVLHCDEVALPKLVAKYGTPLYVYSASMICDRYATFHRAFRESPHTICYSVKANSNLSILRLLARSGSGFDVVSGGELERVLRVDKKAAARVVFSGVGKSAAEMDLALKSGILIFNIDSESEVDLLAERAARYATALRSALGDLDIHLLLEPGRFVIGNAGILLSRVLYTKQNGTKLFVIVDAAMNDLIRPTLYSAHHEILPVRKPKNNG